MSIPSNSDGAIAENISLNERYGHDSLRHMEDGNASGNYDSKDHVEFDANDPFPWIADNFAPTLVRNLNGFVFTSQDEKRSHRLNLVVLQRMNLQLLQCELTVQAKRILDGERPAENWPGTLRDYVQALQDYDYMVECSNMTRDPFVITGERKLDHQLLKSVLEGPRQDVGAPIQASDVNRNRSGSQQNNNNPALESNVEARGESSQERRIDQTSEVNRNQSGGRQNNDTALEPNPDARRESSQGRRVDQTKNLDQINTAIIRKNVSTALESKDSYDAVYTWENEALAVVHTRSSSRHSFLRTRLLIAFCGASLLIAPMWLMMLNTSLYTALISTTGFIFVFGIIMAFVLERPMDVLANTAAYAAVLVVFVGLTRDPGS